MVFSVKMTLKLTTGTTCQEPDTAIQSAKDMLEKYLADTPLGTLKSPGLFSIELTDIEAEGLNGVYTGRTFIVKDEKVIEITKQV